MGGASTHVYPAATRPVLTIASAKFIMSLAGLTGSIVFGLFLKFWEVELERVASALSSEVRSRLEVVTPERALQQLLASSLRVEALIGAAR